MGIAEAAYVLAKKLKNSVVSGWKTVSLDEQTGTITHVDNDGNTFRYTYPIPSDGKDGFNIFRGSGCITSGDKHYFLQDYITTEGREIQVGDYVLTLHKIFRIDEIKHAGRTGTEIQYWCNTTPMDLKGADGVSPSISVKTSTESEYILTITDSTHTFDTPNLRPSDIVTKDYVDDLVSETILRLEELINQKQSKLIPGNNISIVNNVISATGVVANPTQPQEQPVSKSPTFKLVNAPIVDSSKSGEFEKIEEVLDTDGQPINLEDNLYIHFEDEEPDMYIDENGNLFGPDSISAYIDDETGDLMVEVEE